MPVKNRLLPLALAFTLGALVAAAPEARAARKRSAATTTHRVAPGDALVQPGPSVDVTDPSRPPQVTAQSVLVFDPFTGRILCEKNADTRRAIASTQKLLTALIVAESGALSVPVRIEAADIACEPTKLNPRAGDVYSRRDLLAALLVHSCNDVARCLARDNAGSYEEFAEKMNAKVASLGGKDSHFVNPNGLPSPGQPQYSTARDLARIARAAYGNQLIRAIVATQRLTFQYNSGKTIEYTNTNRVLARYPLCNGMKTGYTDAAGHCLVSSATTGTRSVIAVCLGDNKSIWNDSQRLLAWGLIADERATDPEL